MVDSCYGPKPTNKIVVAGEPLVQIMEVETAGTNMLPGRLVVKGTGDHDAAAAGAPAIKAWVKVIGWLGYEHTIKKHRPATVDTVYATAAQAAVLSGGGFVIVASLPAGQTIVKGDKLIPAANGQLVILPNFDLNATFNNAEVELELAEAKSIVAIAEESVTSGGASADIMVRSLI